MHTDGVPSTHAGLPVLRPRGVITPCWKCPKLAHTDDKRRANAHDPTPRSRRAIRHFMECRAVGSFPPDPIVKMCAGVIDDVERSVSQAKADGLLELGRAVLNRLASGG